MQNNTDRLISSVYRCLPLYSCRFIHAEKKHWKGTPEKTYLWGKEVETEVERGIFVHLLFLFLSLNLHACVIKKTVSTGKAAI